MMATRRRHQIGIAALASLALVITACGGSSNNSSGTTSAASTAAAATSAASGTGTSAAGGSSAAAGSSGGSSAATGSSAAAATSPVDTLIMANAVKVDTLDPAQNSLNESIWMDQNIYSRLVQTDPTGTKMLPDLATSWDVSSDQLTYTFHLRDAKFADGTPVTAQDTAWSINRAKNLDGGWGFLITAVKSITAKDAKTVVIQLTQPHSPLLADLGIYAFAVLPEAEVTKQGDAFFNKPIGSGPFMVTSLNPDTEVDFTRNPNYYGLTPKITNLKIQIVPNDNTRVLDLQAKKVDVIENPPGNLLSQIAQNPNLNTNLFPSTRVDFIQMSGKDQYFKNQKVREAVKAALDLDAMNQLAYQGNAVPATSFMPYKMLYWNTSLPKVTPDLTKAKQLLSDAGFPNGFTTNLITTSGDAAGQAEAVVMKDALSKIGITLNIESYEQATAYAKVRTGVYGMAERYWTNDIIDPDEVVTFGVDVHAGSNSFDTFWDNPQAASLAKQARSEPDPTKRQDLYNQIQQIVYDEVPYLPIEYVPYRYASGKWVHGFHVSPLGNYNDSLLTLTVDQH
jgi:peptide/nickel transport system substrate-binding protein